MARSLPTALVLAMILLAMSGRVAAAATQPVLVLQSDFGLLDGAVASMKGVAVGVSPDIHIYDLTHHIEPFNIWQGALRLAQTAEYWPAGTVFVSVVDPGVGTDRKSIVLRTKSGHYFVTPDNGTLTFVAPRLGIDAVREIDEAVNRRKDSEKSFTFHGRDVYAYTAARLAAGVITFEQVGRELPPAVITIPHEAARFEDGVVHGNIQTDDGNYGNIWTNVDRATFGRLGVSRGDVVRIKILKDGEEVLNLSVPFVATFGAVAVGKPLLYLNSLDSVSLAINQKNFAKEYGVGSGPAWSIQIRR
ncbi:MAG TPA: S-adenosyl-l-methionine hydroxide adenosyltransferase family protein [Steroidobacteraceae bacterium]|nr:S-adenosyl-l-methionine hydroxide adenosyltransferase family protein [Steroidobacteraceae bacterium]